MSEADIEKFRLFLENYEVGDICVLDKTKLKNPSDSIRILVVGYTGEGKSSFVRTLLRLCGNDEAAYNVSVSGLRDLANTAILKHHRLTNTNGKNYFICDSPGFNPPITPTSVENICFSVDTMVKGYVPDGGVPYHKRRPSWFPSIFPYKDSTMHAVIFLAWPPVDTKSKLDLAALMNLKKIKHELEITLGKRPFFFVFTAADILEEIPNSNMILDTFGGSVFLVGKEQDGKPMPSVSVYQQLIKSIFREVEEYRLTQTD